MTGLERATMYIHSLHPNSFTKTRHTDVTRTLIGGGGWGGGVYSHIHVLPDGFLFNLS